MNEAFLEVRRNDGKHLATVARRIGRVELVDACSDGVGRDIARMLVHGISELVGAPGRRALQRTLASDQTFLERLALHLARYGFVVELRSSSDTAVTRAVHARMTSRSPSTYFQVRLRTPTAVAPVTAFSPAVRSTTNASSEWSPTAAAPTGAE